MMYIHMREFKSCGNISGETNNNHTYKDVDANYNDADDDFEDENIVSITVYDQSLNKHTNLSVKVKFLIPL